MHALEPADARVKHADATARVRWRRSRWAAAGGAWIVLLPVLFGGCNARSIAIAAAPASFAAQFAAPGPGAADAHLNKDRLTVEFRHFALNALLLPLLDDEVPGRIADPSLVLECADANGTLDGRRPYIGAPVPGAFTLRWTLDRCLPLGEHLEVSGQVHLKVHREGERYVAVVQPHGLALRSQHGVDVLVEPFVAALDALAPPR